MPGKPQGLAGPFFVFAAFGVLVLVALRLRLPDDDPTYAARGQVAGRALQRQRRQRVTWTRRGG